MPGIEPGAFHMQSERSTAELHPRSTTHLSPQYFTDFYRQSFYVSFCL